MLEANASSIYGQNNSRPITLQIKIIKLEILQSLFECPGNIARSMLIIPQLKTSVISLGLRDTLLVTQIVVLSPPQSLMPWPISISLP